MTNATNEALDLLDQLSNPSLAKRAEMERNRPMDRSPLRHFRADILGKGSDLQVTQRTPQGSQFPQTGVWLDINVTEVYDSGPHAFPTGNTQLWVRLPGPGRDGGHNPNVNSEGVQMVMSAGLNSLRDLPGKKGVEFKDEVHTYMGRSQQNGEWVDREFTTWFYKLTIGANRTNGATPAAPTAEGIEAALALLAGDGMTDVAFGQAAAKDKTINKDGALISAIVSGKFAADMIAEGKLLRDGEILVRP